MRLKSEEELKSLCEKTAKSLGFKVCGIEYRGNSSPTLTVFLDKEGGIDLNDCEAFSNAISDPLDALDPTDGVPFTFNVSSRGIDWAFKTDEDFASHIGKMVEVKLKNSVKGKKYFDGVLLSYDKKAVTVKVDAKTTLTIDLKNLSKMNEYIDFN